MAKKKSKPIIDWTYDVTFDGAEIHVKARTAAEAKKKAIAKLKNTPASKFIYKKNSYIDKRY